MCLQTLQFYILMQMPLSITLSLQAPPLLGGSRTKSLSNLPVSTTASGVHLTSLTLKREKLCHIGHFSMPGYCARATDIS